jgi:hypothetical protein
VGNPPNREYLKDDGSKGYSPIVWFPERDRYGVFQKWAFAEIEKLKATSVNKNHIDELPF